MKFSFNIIFLPLMTMILLVLVFNMIDYLAAEKYIVECFTSGTVSDKTTHTVDLPLNTTYSCQNFCGPTSRCAITGQQCFTDFDCPGCQRNLSSSPKTSECIPGNNDAGKLTVGVTPTYSPLTSTSAV